MHPIQFVSKLGEIIPIESMYGILTYISHQFLVNVGKYTSAMPWDPYGIGGFPSIFPHQPCW